MSLQLRSKCDVCQRWFKSIRNHRRQSDCRFLPDGMVIQFPSQTTISAADEDSTSACYINSPSNVHLEQPSSPVQCFFDPDDSSHTSSHGESQTFFEKTSSFQQDCNGSNPYPNQSPAPLYTKSPTVDTNDQDTKTGDALVFANSVGQAHGADQVSPFPNPNIPQFIPIQESGYNLFSRQELSLLRIMNACDEAGCPRYFFDRLLAIISHEVDHNKFDPSKKCPVRETLLRRLGKQCPTPAPIAIPISLENDTTLANPEHYLRGHRDVVFAHCFEFEDQLIDLISNESIFGNLANLDVNPVDPFSKFSRSDGRVDEVLSGSWYDLAHRKLIKDPENEFLAPIIIYIDKTGTDVLQRNGLEPVIFSLAMISRKKRQDVIAWRPLGYIPDLQAKSSAVKDLASSNKKTSGRSTRHYHACLKAILASLIKAQQCGGIVADLRLGDHVKKVRLITPVAFVIGDAKSGDMLCGRYGNYNTNRISRACDASSTDCSNTTTRCNYIVQADMQKLCNLALTRKGAINDKPRPSDDSIDSAENHLQQLSSHAVDNAFHYVNFGGDPRGIYGGTPTDLMHAFLEGVLKYCMGIIFSSLSTRMKARLDKIVDECFAQNRNSQRKFFPRTNFRKGFTNLTLLTACEWEGVCFTVMLLTMMESATFFVECIEGHLCSFADLLELLEALLAFHAWCKCMDSFQCATPNDVANIRSSIVALLDMVKKRLPRTDGMGWDIQKFHELLHIPDDIARFGSPRNTDAGPGERSLKYFAKKPSRTSQKRNDDFLDQVTLRIHEYAMFAKAKRLTDPENEWEHCIKRAKDDCQACHYSDDDDDDDDDTSQHKPVSSQFIGNARFSINFGPNGYEGTFSLTSSLTKGLVEVHPLVINWFIDDQSSRKYVGNVKIWTEYSRKGVRFRSHPNYRSAGPWYDWAMVRWKAGVCDEDDSQDSSPTIFRAKSSPPPADTNGWFESTDFPSKILCFFEDPITHQQRMLVHSCDDRDNDNEDSNLCQVWYLQFHNAKIEEPSVPAPSESATSPVRTKRKKVIKTIAVPALYNVTVDAIVAPVLSGRRWWT